MPSWDASQYLKFQSQRTQPAIDLVNRIRLSNRKGSWMWGAGRAIARGC